MLMKYDEVMTSSTPQVGKIGSFVCACVFPGNTCGCTPKTAAHSDIPSRIKLIQWDATRTPTMLFCLC